VRWQERSSSDWIQNIAEKFNQFSKENSIELELIEFREGSAKARLLQGTYTEDLHFKLQDFMDKNSSGIAIIFDL
jgi:hypothetical protein